MNSPLSGIKSIIASAREALSPLVGRIMVTVAEKLTNAASAARSSTGLPPLRESVPNKKSDSDGDTSGDGEGGDSSPASLPDPPAKKEAVGFGPSGTRFRKRELNAAEYADWCRASVKEAEEDKRSDAYLLAWLRRLAEAERRKADENDEKLNEELDRIRKLLQGERRKKLDLSKRNKELSEKNSELAAKLEEAMATIEELRPTDSESDQNSAQSDVFISPSVSSYENEKEETGGYEPDF